MSLLQDVLKSTTLSQNQTNELEARLKKLSTNQMPEEDDDEEIVAVASIPGTPQRTRPSSPTKSSSRQATSESSPLRSGSSTKSKSSSIDPLRVFPTEVSQRIFGRLGLRDLSNCSVVSQKWNKSQTLNYVWYLHYRKDTFHDESLPSGKWTKRESKQNWRQTLMKSAKQAALDSDRSVFSGYTTPTHSGSGYQTPRELKEEQWRQEAEESKPGKIEMRGMYKELGGRKFKGKGKFGASGGGVRDKGGWGIAAEY